MQRLLGLLALAAMSLSASADSKGVVFLIPGTWNSMLPGCERLNHLTKVVESNPYFSSAILDVMEEQNYDYYVVKNLNPFGDLYKNGEDAAQEIRTWYNLRFPKHDKPITLLAHSMGGAYGLHALKKLVGLPVRQIVMVSTPLDGTPLADAFLDNLLSRTFIDTVNEVAGESFDFRGLYQATAAEMQSLLKVAMIVQPIQYYTVASSQRTPPTPFHMLWSEYLNPLFTLISVLSSGDTDGMVPVSSALGRKTGMRFKELAVRGNLDHAEQVLDYRILEAFGAADAEFVQKEQTRLYRKIISSLNP